MTYALIASRLEDFLKALPEGSVGYALSPTSAQWFRRSDTGLIDANGASLDVSRAYFVRGFDGRLDLAWERIDAHGGVSRAEQVPGERDDHIESAMLLWGSVTMTKPGWVFVQEDRIDGFWVPLDDETAVGDRLRMVQREQLAVDPHGNVHVAATHLIRIEVAR